MNSTHSTLCEFGFYKALKLPKCFVINFNFYIFQSNSKAYIPLIIIIIINYPIITGLLKIDRDVYCCSLSPGEIGSYP